MTEYWKSTPKHYCKVCNQWIADTKSSKESHVNGEKHKQKLEIFNQNKRKEALHGASNERDLAIQMAAINRAARDAIAQDRLDSSDFAQSTSMRNRPSRPTSSLEQPYHTHTEDETTPIEPPMPALPSELFLAAPSRQGGLDLTTVSEETGKMIAENLRDRSGMYVVRGQNYLEGEMHSSRINGLVLCEIFVEDEDDWVTADSVQPCSSARGNSARGNSGGGNSGGTPTFRVTYQVEGVPVVEDNVGVDRIRILANKDGTAMFRQRKVHTTAVEISVTEEGDTIDDANAIDATTGTSGGNGVGLFPTVGSSGLGEWTVVDDPDDRPIQPDAPGDVKPQSGGGAKVKVEPDVGGLESDDVLSSYDPYGTNKYKGISLSMDSVHEGTYTLPKGAPVSFKKRKAAGEGVAAHKAAARSFRASDA